MLLLVSFINVSHAYEISNEKINLLNDPNGAWNFLALSSDKTTYYYAELNMYEKQSDGSILVPLNSKNINDKNNRWNGNFSWVRLSCIDDEFIDLGAYVNGRFERDIKIKSSSGNVAVTLKRFYCPVYSSRGDRILVYTAQPTPDGKSFFYSGWNLDSLKTDSQNPQVLTVSFHSLLFRNDKLLTDAPKRSEIDCKNKNIKNFAENKIYNTNNSEGGAGRIILNTACKINDILKMTQSEPLFKDKRIKISLEDAQVDCKSLGYTEKSELFETCVKWQITDLIKSN